MKDIYGRQQYSLKNKVKKKAVNKAKNMLWNKAYEKLENFLGSTRSKVVWNTIKCSRTDNK